MKNSKNSLNSLTLSETHNGLRKKKFSSSELTQACLTQIEKFDDKIKAFVTVSKEEALKQADMADRKIAKKEDLDKPLLGIPVAVKDVLCTENIKTTACSNILANFIPPYDATVVKIIKRQGGVILGKANCDAFAHGASTENSDFFPTHNPWDLSRVPGGSSGGSAAATAADMCIYSLGTDTGGSVRFPAAFCSVVGIRPTYGRVSRYGLIAMTSSTDTIGPIAKSVLDTAIVLKEISGKDEKDSTTSIKLIDDYKKYLNRPIKDLKLGLPKEFFVEDGMEEGVRKVTDDAIKTLERLGAKVKTVSLPHSQYAVACYYIITPCEVSANLARFDGIKYGYSSKNADSLLEVYTKSRKEGFGAEAKRRIMIGTYALSAGYYDAYYLQAQKVRTVIKKEVEEVLREVDLLITPVSSHVPFKIGEKTSDPLQMYLEDIFMSAAAMAGIPAISIPCGFSEDLPVGLQIMGNYFDEKRVLNLAYVYEQTTGWYKRKPKLDTSNLKS
ncbi:Asp-tRNA(Asn)/Glu-tRNA(Gln) amidotransferase GatCAB subunit A [bacterium (Candidatus Torokbacteria) CG_4_10_14_0_2_um_filter_35_8]|nr:MAG: Asp-tRNA(Asn)/Glu-tRNA(Gln) amidotransferase GatCAB subunit A [bacterium (Candidatus Torokbacteria) CG_4_10_14_0_2_um_filter_35_8]